MTPEFLRLFVSLPVPPEIRGRIFKFARELDSHMPAEAVRWAPEEQIHLTLQFLGKVDTAAVPDLERALDNAVQGIGSMRLEAVGLGAFPSLRNARVIWIGLEGDTDSLLRLWAQVAEATRQWCEKEEARKFSPHLTIGRVREPQGRAIRKISAALGDQPSQRFGEWRAKEILLMRSQLSPNGATHTVLRKCAL
jgi:2'-5' RNA ligase